MFSKVSWHTGQISSSTVLFKEGRTEETCLSAVPFLRVVNCRIIYDGDGVVKKTVDRVILSVAVAIIVPVVILHEGVINSDTDAALLAELLWKEELIQLGKILLL